VRRVSGVPGGGMVSVSPVAVVPGLFAGVVPSTVLREGCGKTSSGWRSSGVVKNPEDGLELLLITVFFRDKHTTVSDFAQARIQVRAGNQVEWGAEKSFSTTPTVRCVLIGVGKRARQPGVVKGLCRLGVFRGGSVCSCEY